MVRVTVQSGSADIGDCEFPCAKPESKKGSDSCLGPDIPAFLSTATRALCSIESHESTRVPRSPTKIDNDWGVMSVKSSDENLSTSLKIELFRAHS